MTEELAETIGDFVFDVIPEELLPSLELLSADKRMAYYAEIWNRIVLNFDKGPAQ